MGLQQVAFENFNWKFNYYDFEDDYFTTSDWEDETPPATDLEEAVLFNKTYETYRDKIDELRCDD